MSSFILNPSANDNVQAAAKKLISESQFNSIEWRTMHKGVVHSEGVASVSSATMPVDDAIYRIYSMTKPIVSFVAMQLIEEGKLKLDDLVSQFIPAMGELKVLEASGELTVLSQAITIEHLLTHTAGFSYDFLPDCAVAERYRDVQISGDASRTLAQVIGMLSNLPLASQPGTQWRYSVATDVLAHVLENVTGLDLPELLHMRIFQPLGMQDTAFYVAEQKINRLLPMFGSRELGQVMSDSQEPNTLNPLDVSASYPAEEEKGFYRGGHGLFSTLNDYLKFMHVLETGESLSGQSMLSSKSLALMWGDRIDKSLQPLVLGYNVLGGYGWNLMGRVMLDPEQCEFNTAMGEGGWAGAASTYFWIDRSNNYSGIAMSQYLGSTAHLGALMHHAAYSTLTT